MMHEVLTLERLNAVPPGEAAALLAARRLQGASWGDAAVLQAWLQQDQAHLPAWESAQRAVAVFDDGEDDDLLLAMRQTARRARPATALPWRRMAAAAAILLAVGAGLLVYPSSPFRLGEGPAPATSVPAPGPSAPKPQDYVTARGDRQDLVLQDGSRMTLDAESAVRVAFTAGRRSLRLLKGRASFDVRPDALRPFAVAAGGREVIAVGTRFDVRVDADRVRVVLSEGRVSIASIDQASAPVMLSPGQQFVATANGRGVVTSADLDAANSWQRGYLTFSDDTLAAAAGEMNRYGGDRLVVRDPRVAQLRVSGAFRAGDAARFGRTLAQVHPVRVVRTSPDELEIVPAG